MPNMKDKRDECGCHRECDYTEHSCDNPCKWPGCLTEAESMELADSILREMWEDER